MPRPRRAGSSPPRRGRHRLALRRGRQPGRGLVPPVEPVGDGIGRPGLTPGAQGAVGWHQVGGGLRGCPLGPDRGAHGAVRAGRAMAAGSGRVSSGGRAGEGLAHGRCPPRVSAGQRPRAGHDAGSAADSCGPRAGLCGLCASVVNPPEVASVPAVRRRGRRWLGRVGTLQWSIGGEAIAWPWPRRTKDSRREPRRGIVAWPDRPTS